MKLVVETDHVFGIARARQPAVQLLQPLEGLRVREACESERFRIEDGSDVVDLLELLQRQRADEEAEAGNAGERPFRREAAQGLSQGSAADPELPREVDLVDPFARGKPPVEDPLKGSSSRRARCRLGGVALVSDPRGSRNDLLLLRRSGSRSRNA